MGEGNFGEVICLVEKDGSCEWVVKVIQPVATSEEQRKFEQELMISTLASEKGFGPKVLKGWQCEGKGYIIMERLDVTLAKYIAANGEVVDEPVQKMLVDTVTKMCQAGVIHDDLHEDNVMLKVDKKTGKPTHVYVIDYGLASLPRLLVGNILSQLGTSIMVNYLVDHPTLPVTGQKDILKYTGTVFPGGVMMGALNQEDLSVMEEKVMYKINS